MPTVAVRRAALTGLLLVAGAPLAGAQNMLQNPDFDSSTNGWQTSSPGNLVQVTSRGWPDDLAPGAVRFTVNLGDSGDLYQCLPVTPGTRVLSSMRALLPSSELPNVGIMRLYATSCTDLLCTSCSGSIAFAYIDDTTGATDAWQRASEIAVVPAGTIAAIVDVVANKVPGSDSANYQFYADAVYFGRPVKGDFNDDGYADLVLDNLTDQSHRVWKMGGGVRDVSTLITPDAYPVELKLAVTDDFNDDGRTDLVFRNQTTGALVFWFMNGVDQAYTGSLANASAPPLSWTLAAAADFNHDGQPDLLWRDETTQQLQIWTMSATTYTGTLTPSPASAVDGNWSVVVAADLDRDGNTDLLWYNATSGKIVRWLMNAAVQRTSGGFTNPANAGANNWKVVAAGEYKVAKGTSSPDGVDIVWRNETSGKIVEWLMDASGTRVAGFFTTPDSPSSPLDWTVVGPR